MRRALVLSVLAAAGLGLAGVAAQQALLPPGAPLADLGEARRQLAEARRQGASAQTRAEQLERQAAAAGAAAEKSAAEAAAAAARIQQAEAEVSAREATIAMVDRQREALRERIAARQQPLVRLTAALQRLSRRPLLFSLFHPGSVRDQMHLSAALATIVPQIAARTDGLRAELDRARILREQAEAGVQALRREQADLAARRTRLAALETSQRLAARESAGVADRESERALALAEQARDLGSLADDLSRAGKLREELAALPGPVMRPARPGDTAAPALPQPAVLAARPALAFILPAQGRLVAGFGEESAGTGRSRGIAIATTPAAQIVAAAPGRVAYAGAYRGYGQIVIVDHGGGWTSLVTGLAQLSARVGDAVVAGSPLGTTGPARGVVSFELRRAGEPVNPLDFTAAR
jgi:septal ring factor EnvC (AmiA/AmiB activator)